MTLAALQTSVFEVGENDVRVSRFFLSDDLHFHAGVARQACLGGLFPIELVASLTGLLGREAGFLFCCRSFVTCITGQLQLLDVVLVAENKIGFLRFAVYTRAEHSKEQSDDARSACHQPCFFLPAFHISSSYPRRRNPPFRQNL